MFTEDGQHASLHVSEIAPLGCISTHIRYRVVEARVALEISKIIIIVVVIGKSQMGQ